MCFLSPLIKIKERIQTFILLIWVWNGHDRSVLTVLKLKHIFISLCVYYTSRINSSSSLSVCCLYCQVSTLSGKLWGCVLKSSQSFTRQNQSWNHLTLCHLFFFKINMSTHNCNSTTQSICVRQSSNSIFIYFCTFVPRCYFGWKLSNVIQ